MHYSDNHIYEGRGGSRLISYLVTLALISSLVGIATYASYGEGEDRTLRSALAVILISVTVSPVISFVGGAVDGGFFEGGFEIPELSVEDTDFAERAEQAFAEGVRRFVAEEFSLSEGDIKVRLFGFSAEKMRAEKIKIILSGRAALADNRMIAERISSEGLGVCEVELDVS